MNRIIIVNANKAPTNQLTLRKVIMHAVNKAAIIDKELAGMAEPVDTLFPKNAPYCGVDLTPRWDYDIEKAELLRCPAGATTKVVEKIVVKEIVIMVTDMTFSDATAAAAFVESPNAKDVMAESIAESLAGVTKDMIVIKKLSVGSGSRRLSLTIVDADATESRRLAATVQCEYEINLPSTYTGDPISTASVDQAVLKAKVAEKATAAGITGVEVTGVTSLEPVIVQVPVPVPVPGPTPKPKDDDDEGVAMGVVIGIIVGAVVVIILAGIAFYMFGKKQGAMQQKLIQQKQGGGGYAGQAVGNPSAGEGQI